MILGAGTGGLTWKKVVFINTGIIILTILLQLIILVFATSTPLDSKKICINIHKMNRSAQAFLKHLYLVLSQDHEPQCLHWDISDKHKIVWHGDNAGLADYFQVRRGRFSVSNEKSFLKKLEELRFVVCEQRFTCHPGMKCRVYQLTDGSTFYRGMHACESETGPALKRQSHTPAQPTCLVQPSPSSPVTVDDEMFELQADSNEIQPLVLDDSMMEDISSFSVEEFLSLPDVMEALDSLPPWSLSESDQ